MNRTHIAIAVLFGSLLAVMVGPAIAEEIAKNMKPKVDAAPYGIEFGGDMPADATRDKTGMLNATWVSEGGTIIYVDGTQQHGICRIRTIHAVSDVRLQQALNHVATEYGRQDSLTGGPRVYEAQWGDAIHQ